ncbi:hypothetical protein D5R81_04515 [Parashewanella spongiae]|uniref:Uncharacterized protein n=1 Tax=Parashewanella spongiae TaxID=342950 RepID=A0A3A6TW38_9GAMM|nr:hypothetical protein [Parashewanella spongiae]RJY18578.1 hypothetical protein D5R81_04515 [Parashewanella spongiae]
MSSVTVRALNSVSYEHEDYLVIKSDQEKVREAILSWCRSLDTDFVIEAIRDIFSTLNSPALRLEKFEALKQMVPEHYKNRLLLSVSFDHKCTMTFNVNDEFCCLTLPQNEYAQSLEQLVKITVHRKELEELKCCFENDLPRSTSAFGSDKSHTYRFDDGISEETKIDFALAFLEKMEGIGFAYYLGYQGVFGDMHKLKLELFDPSHSKEIESHIFEFITPSLLKVIIEYKSKVNEAFYEENPELTCQYIASKWRAVFLIQNGILCCVDADADVSITPNA